MRIIHDWGRQYLIKDGKKFKFTNFIIGELVLKLEFVSEDNKFINVEYDIYGEEFTINEFEDLGIDVELELIKYVNFILGVLEELKEQLIVRT